MKRLKMRQNAREAALPKLSRKYLPLKLIGRGSFGIVYLVRRQSDSRQYVMKLVNMTAMREEDRAEAIKECEVLTKLRRHPHIIRILEHFYDEDGKLCIVMDYADGGDLAQRIDIQKRSGGAGFAEEQVLDWFVQICLALKHAHDRKVMHRDLKPQNIFLTRENFVRLGDFGISKVLGSTMSVAQTCVGTPLYLAPELCEGKQYNSKCDVWSLGVILYELLTLRHPFHAKTMPALIMQIVSAQPEPLPSGTTRDLDTLIRDMLVKDPDNRPRIHDILERDFVKARIANFLNEKLLESEFSHTVIHVANPEADAYAVPAGKVAAETPPAPPANHDASEVAPPRPGGPAPPSGEVKTGCGPAPKASGGHTSGRSAANAGPGTRRSGASTARAGNPPPAERTLEALAEARAQDAARIGEMQRRYAEQRAQIRRDRITRERAMNRQQQGDSEVLVPASGRRASSATAAAPATAADGGDALGRLLVAANPGWRLLTDEEMKERRAGLDAQREAVVEFAQKYSESEELKGEALRQIINSAQREVLQIAADTAKLRKKYVLVLADPAGPTPRAADGDAGDDGITISLPPRLQEADVAVLIELRGDDEGEFGEGVATVFQQMAMSAGDTALQQTAIAAEAQAATSAMSPAIRAASAAAAADPGAHEGTFVVTRCGAGGCAWEFGADEAGKPAAKRRPSHPQEALAVGDRRAGGSAPAVDAGTRPPPAPSAVMQEALRGLPPDAPLSSKVARIREVLTRHLGSAAALERVLQAVREEEADAGSEQAVEALLGDRAALLPDIRRIIDLEECLPLT